MSNSMEDDYEGLVEAIYVQPESDGVQECVNIEVVAGPKRYVRYWPASKKTEWGWSLHPTAREVWRREPTAHNHEFGFLHDACPSEVAERDRLIQTARDERYALAAALAQTEAERDRLRIAYEQAHAVTAAAEAERDRLMQALDRVKGHAILVLAPQSVVDMVDEEMSRA